MRDNEVSERTGIQEEVVRQLRSRLGYSAESLVEMPAGKLARTMEKLQIRDRPRARVEHERGALCDDNGEIGEGGRGRALRQLQELREAEPNRAAQRAGVPTGSALFAVNARAEDPTAGLHADNTGWTELGPGNIGGRTRGIVIDPNDTNRILAAGVGGGVWLTTDGGNSWTPTDDLMANLAVCSLVIDPTDANTVYAGTGEGFPNVDALRGDGIFVSNDGGVTWTSIAFTASNGDFHYVNSLAISDDGQTLLAGTNSGILRSTDAGHQNWTEVLNASIGIVAFDPADSMNAVAGVVGGGGAYYSTDGGAAWQQATGATASGDRVHLCYAPGTPGMVYASVEANPSQIWRSTDGGQTYTSRDALSGGVAANFLGAQGWYDNVIWAGDPTDSDLVIVGGVDLWRSTDGGDTLTPISTWWSDQSAHADQHAIVSDPGYDGVANRRVYFGNDGGVYRADNARTVGDDPSPHDSGWVNLNNGYGVTQLYYGAGHLGTNTILGGAQDNGTLRYTPATGAQWNETWGGDGGDVASDPTDPQIWYGEYVYLSIFRNTVGGAAGNLATDYICGRFWDGQQWAWKPAPFTIPDAQNSAAQFIAPFELDPNEPQRILGGGLSLWRTDDARAPNADDSGPTWAAIKGQIGAQPWNHSITSIAIAEGNSDLVVVGHANGNVYVSQDATGVAPQWNRVDTNGIGANRQCLALTIDPDDHDVIYAAFGGYQAGNLWRTTDGGQTWDDMSGGLPEVPLRDVSLHPQRSSWIYLATDMGIFASEDGGVTWSPTNEGPANVACRDLFWMGCRLVAVTHGRGMFEIDISITDAFPRPQLSYDGSENYSVGGNDFTRYKLSVTNRGDYPDSLFRASPDLPPCGQNTSASRTWVDIYNGDNDQRLYGFCALGDSDDLGRLWFALPQGDTPPLSVYIVLRDRRCPATYKSNEVTLGVASPRCQVDSVVATMNTPKKIHVRGSSSVCAGGTIDVHGPRGPGSRIIRNAGGVDASGNFDVVREATHAAAGEWRVTIRDIAGNSCCVSDWKMGTARSASRKSTWG